MAIDLTIVPNENAQITKKIITENIPKYIPFSW